MAFTNMPNELLLEVFQWVELIEPNSLRAVSATCCRFHNMVAPLIHREVILATSSMNYAQSATSQYTRRTGQSLIRATHRIMKNNSQLPKFIKTITIAPAIFGAAVTAPVVLVKFLTVCDLLRTIRWWSNYMRPEVQAFLRDRTGTIDLELFLFHSSNIAKNIEPFPPCFRPRLEGTIGSGSHFNSDSVKDIITTLPHIKSITDTHWRNGPVDEVLLDDIFLGRGAKVGLVEELKFVSWSVETMQRLSQARAWDNLRVLHICDPKILGTLHNRVPVLETLVLYEEEDYYGPDGRAYSSDNPTLQIFHAPALKSIAIYGAFFSNTIDFIEHFCSTIVDLKLVWTRGYDWDEDGELQPPSFIYDDELSRIGWNCLQIESLELSVKETFEELDVEYLHSALSEWPNLKHLRLICFNQPGEKEHSANLNDHDFESLLRSMNIEKSKYTECALNTLEIVVLEYGASSFNTLFSVHGPRQEIKPSVICRLSDDGFSYTTRYGPVYLQTPHHWGTASAGVVRENASISVPPEVNATLRPFYAKFGCPHYDALIEFSKRLGRNEWAFPALVLSTAPFNLMTLEEFGKAVKVQSIQNEPFEHAMFPSRLNVCNEHGHAKLLQEATLALEENGTYLIQLRAMARKELQYWQQLKAWRSQHGLHASTVDDISPTTLNHDFSGLLPNLPFRDWCAEELSVHFTEDADGRQGGVGHRPGLSRCTHPLGHGDGCTYCDMSTTQPKPFESFGSTG